MSSHILNQFDESWLNEITEPYDTFNSSQVAQGPKIRPIRLTRWRFSELGGTREMLVILFAILIAVTSILYVAHANTRVTELERQLQILESRSAPHRR